MNLRVTRRGETKRPARILSKRSEFIRTSGAESAGRVREFIMKRATTGESGRPINGSGNISDSVLQRPVKRDTQNHRIPASAGMTTLGAGAGTCATAIFRG